MRVSVKDVLRNFSELSDRALAEPLIITKNGRDRLVLMSVDEYNWMRDLVGERTRNEDASDAAADRPAQDEEASRRKA